MRQTNSLLAPVWIVFLLFPGAASALASVGEITRSNGYVEAQRGDEPGRELTEGDAVYQADTITTGADAGVEIRFRDDTVFNLGPDSSFQVESYEYGAEAEEPSFSARVLKGTFRFVTGLVGSSKPDAFKVNTAVATIGIRGTHVVGEADATSSTVILMEEDDGSVGAIQVSNQYGSVDIAEAGYGTEVPDEHSPPSPPRRMQMNTVENITRSLQTIQRMNMPRPRMR